MEMYKEVKLYDISNVILKDHKRHYKLQGDVGLVRRLLVEADGLDDDLGDGVRDAVAARPPVLQVAVTLLRALPRYPDAAASVGHAGAEVVDAGSLVQPSQTPLVVLALIGIVGLDVPDVMLGEVVDGGLDGLHAAWLPHGLGGEVGVGPGTVPVPGHGLGVEADHDPELLGDSEQEVASHPQVVTHVNTLGRADLELPLGGHDLGVGATDPDAGIQTGAVVSLHDV